jgi:hypothetical protein
VKDVVRAVSQLRLALHGRARGTDTSAGSALEQYLVVHWAQWAGLPRKLPPWLRAGVPRWIMSAARMTESSESAHRCGGGADPLGRLKNCLGAEVVVTPSDSAVFGRVVAGLASVKGRLAAGVPKLIEGGRHDAAGFEGAFGPTADSAIGAALSEGAMSGGGGAATTCEAGTIACSICDGDGECVLTCPDCAGTGRLACPSCEGRSRCPAMWCVGGIHYLRRLQRQKCVFCKGACGAFHTCAVREDGSLGCWGSGVTQGTCTGATHDECGMSLPPEGETFREVAAGFTHSCAAHEDGTVECWGSNTGNRSPPPADLVLW